MTLDQFFEELERATKVANAKWELVGGAIRTGDVMRLDSPVCQCPITFVAAQVLGVEYCLEDYEAAAAELGLDPEETFAEDIITAADCDRVTLDETSESPDSPLPDLRTRLIKACGLPPENTTVVNQEGS